MSQLTDNLYSIASIKSDIKSAIEAKGVDMTGLSFPDYPGAIASISTAFVTETLSVTSNGVYTPGQGVDGFSQVEVSVPSGITEQQMTEGKIIDLSNSASFVATYAFAYNSALETINLPECVSVYSSAFQYCSSLIEVNLPECTSIYSGAFYRCSSLTTISIPKCTYISDQAFQSTALSEVNLPVCTTLCYGAFLWCHSLTHLTLGASVVCQNLGDAIKGSPIASGTGSIYVPASLVSDYQVATNWSSLSSVIFPIPE